MPLPCDMCSVFVYNYLLSIRVIIIMFLTAYVLAFIHCQLILFYLFVLYIGRFLQYFIPILKNFLIFFKYSKYFFLSILSIFSILSKKYQIKPRILYLWNNCYSKILLLFVHKLRLNHSKPAHIVVVSHSRLACSLCYLYIIFKIWNSLFHKLFVSLFRCFYFHR